MKYWGGFQSMDNVLVSFVSLTERWTLGHDVNVRLGEKCSSPLRVLGRSELYIEIKMFVRWYLLSFLVIFTAKRL